MNNSWVSWFGALARRSGVAIALAALTGCGVRSTHVNVNPVSVTTRSPSNVAVVVAVSDAGGSVADLSRDNFELLEAGVPLDARRARLRVRPASAAEAHHAVVLVDMGTKVPEDDRAKLAHDLGEFLGELRRYQSVSLFAFDGQERPRSIARYPRGGSGSLAEDPGVLRLVEMKPRDRASSLYTAVLAGKKELAEQLGKDASEGSLGSLVVIARSPDLAGRTSEDKVREELKDFPYRSYLVKIGLWAKDASLDWLGSDGTVAAASFGTLRTPLEELSGRLTERYRGNYLITYCSPARAGTRSLEIRVRLKDERGRDVRGEAVAEFDASKFTGGCRGTGTAPLANSAKSAPARPARSRAKGVASSARPAVTPPPAASTTPAPTTESAAPPPAPPRAEKPAEPAPAAAPAIVPPPAELGYE